MLVTNPGRCAPIPKCEGATHDLRRLRLGGHVALALHHSGIYDHAMGLVNVITSHPPTECHKVITVSYGAKHQEDLKRSVQTTALMPPKVV